MPRGRRSGRRLTATTLEAGSCPPPVSDHKRHTWETSGSRVRRGSVRPARGTLKQEVSALAAPIQAGTVGRFGLIRSGRVVAGRGHGRHGRCGDGCWRSSPRTTPPWRTPRRCAHRPRKRRKDGRGAPLVSRRRAAGWWCSTTPRTPPPSSRTCRRRPAGTCWSPPATAPGPRRPWQCRPGRGPSLTFLSTHTLEHTHRPLGGRLPGRLALPRRASCWPRARRPAISTRWPRSGRWPSTGSRRRR